MKKTLYQILEVDPNASAEEIDVAYRRLTAMRDTQWPDANMPGLVRQAHEILSDPKRRRAYDASLAVPAATGDAMRDASPAFIETWGKWIVAIVLLAGITWWGTAASSSTVCRDTKRRSTSSWCIDSSTRRRSTVALERKLEVRS